MKKPPLLNTSSSSDKVECVHATADGDDNYYPTKVPTKQTPWAMTAIIALSLSCCCCIGIGRHGHPQQRHNPRGADDTDYGSALLAIVLLLLLACWLVFYGDNEIFPSSLDFSVVWKSRGCEPVWCILLPHTQAVYFVC